MNGAARIRVDVRARGRIAFVVLDDSGFDEARFCVLIRIGKAAQLLRDRTIVEPAPRERLRDAAFDQRQLPVNI